MIGFIEIRTSGLAAGNKRHYNAALKYGWEQTGIYWHEHFREKHFTTAGAAEYGYAPRQGERGRAGSKGFARSYTGRKLKKYGHTRPLELTGESRTLSRTRRVYATRNGARVTMRVPGLNRRSKGTDIRMPEELKTISRAESSKLSQVLESHTITHLSNPGITRTERI